jgi:hypothetical protein
LPVAELRISRAENRRPSRGSLLAYLPDRAEARQTGDDLTNLQSTLYAWTSAPQIAATVSLDNARRAKTSISAHSMGNYALEYALNALLTRKNRPLLVSLMQEVIMVAADVDNDIFKSGEMHPRGNGEEWEDSSGAWARRSAVLLSLRAWRSPASTRPIASAGGYAPAMRI